MSLCEDFAGYEGKLPMGGATDGDLPLDAQIMAAALPPSTSSRLPLAAAASALVEALAPAMFDHRHRPPPSKGRSHSPLLRRRSEGRLKRVASVDDARSWSMSATARRDHLRDIVTHSYEPSGGNRLIPLPALFDALMADKNAEIDALRRSLEDKQGGDGGRRIKSATCLCPRIAKVPPGDHTGVSANPECEALMAEREALLLAALRRLDELQAAADGRDPRRTASEERFQERIRLKARVAEDHRGVRIQTSPSARAAAAAGRSATPPKRSPAPSPSASARLALPEGARVEAVTGVSYPAVTSRSSCPSVKAALQKTTGAEVAPDFRGPAVTSPSSCPSVKAALQAGTMLKASAHAGPAAGSTRDDASPNRPPVLQQPSPTVIFQEPSATVLLRQPSPLMLDEQPPQTQSVRSRTPCASVREAVSSGLIVIKRSNASKEDGGAQAFLESYTEMAPPSPVPSTAASPLGPLRGGADDFLTVDRCPPCPGRSSSLSRDSCPCIPLPTEILGFESTARVPPLSAPPRIGYSPHVVASEALEEGGRGNAEALMAIAERRLENAARRVRPTDSDGVAAEHEREAVLAYRVAALELLAAARSAVAERDAQKQALHQLWASTRRTEPPLEQTEKPVGGVETERHGSSAPLVEYPQRKISSSVPETTVMAFTVEYDLPECCRRGRPGCNAQQQPPPRDDCDCNTQNVAREEPCPPSCLAVGAVANVGGGGADPGEAAAAMNVAEAEAHAQLEQAQRELAQAQRELEAARRCIQQLEQALVVGHIPCTLPDMPGNLTCEVPDQTTPEVMEEVPAGPVGFPLTPCPIGPCPGRPATRRPQSSEPGDEPGVPAVVPFGVIAVDTTNQESTVMTSSHVLAAQDLNAPPQAQSDPSQVSLTCEEVCSPCPDEELEGQSHQSPSNQPIITATNQTQISGELAIQQPSLGTSLHDEPGMSDHSRGRTPEAGGISPIKSKQTVLSEVCSTPGPCTAPGEVCPAVGDSGEVAQQTFPLAGESCVVMETLYPQSSTSQQNVEAGGGSTHLNVGGLGLRQDTIEGSHISASGQITPQGSHTGVSAPTGEVRSVHSGVVTTQPSSGPGVADELSPASPVIESRPCPPVQPGQLGRPCPAIETCPAKRHINPVRCSPHPSPTHLAPQPLPSTHSQPCPARLPPSESCPGPASRQPSPARLSPSGRSGPGPASRQPSPARLSPSGSSGPGAAARQPSPARLSPSGRSGPDLAPRQPSPTQQSPCRSTCAATVPQSSQANDLHPADSQANDQPPADSQANDQPPPDAQANDQPPQDSQANDQSPAASQANDQPPADSQANDQPPADSLANDQPPADSQANDQPPADSQAAQLHTPRGSPQSVLPATPPTSPQRSPSPKPNTPALPVKTCRDDCYTRTPPPCVECPPGGSPGLSDEDREIIAWAEKRLRSTDDLPERLRELRARALECDALCKRIAELEAAAANSGMRDAGPRVSPVASRVPTAPDMPTGTSGVSPVASRLRPDTGDLSVTVSGVSGTKPKLKTPSASVSDVSRPSVALNVPAVKSGVSPTASKTPSSDEPVAKGIVSPPSTTASGVTPLLGSPEVQKVESTCPPCPPVLSLVDDPESPISTVPQETSRPLHKDSSQKSNLISPDESSLKDQPVSEIESSRKPCEDIVCPKVKTQVQEVQTLVTGEISMSPTLKIDSSTQMEPSPTGKTVACQCELTETTDFTCQCPEGERMPSDTGPPEPPYSPPDKDDADGSRPPMSYSKMQMELMALMEDRDAQAQRAEALEREREDLHCRVAELTAEMARMEGLEDDVDALRLEHEEMARRLEEANTTEAALLDTVDRLAEAEEAAAEVLDLRQRVDDLECQLAEARALLDEANAGGDSAERRALQEERDALLRLKCELECAIADQEDEIRRLTAALDRVAASAAGRQPSQTFRGGGDDDDDAHSHTSASRTDGTATFPSAQSTTSARIAPSDRHDELKDLRSQLVASQAQVECLRTEVATLPALQLQAKELRERLDIAAVQLERVAKAQENASLDDQERSRLIDMARVEQQRADGLLAQLEELQRHVRELEEDRSSSDALLQQVLDLKARLKMADAEHERAEALQAKLDVLQEEMALQAKQLCEQKVVAANAVEVAAQEEVSRESVTLLHQRIMELQQLLNDTARERDDLRRMTDSGPAASSAPCAAAATIRCGCPSCGTSGVCINTCTPRAASCGLAVDPDSEEGLRVLLVEATRRARSHLARAAAAEMSAETIARRRRLRALLEEHEQAMAAERARAVSPTRDRQRPLAEDEAAPHEQRPHLPPAHPHSPSLERIFAMPPSSHDDTGAQQESKSLSRIEGHRGMAPGRIHQVAAAERPPSPVEGVAAAMALRSEVERALAQLWGSYEQPTEEDRRALSMAVFRRSEAFVSALSGAPIEARSEGQNDGTSHSTHGALKQRLYRVTEERDSLAAALAVAEEELGSMRLQKDADRKRLARQAHQHAEQVALLRSDPTAMLDASPAEEEMNRLQREMDDLLHDVARYRRAQEKATASPSVIHQMQKELDDLRAENETLRTMASQRRSDFTLDVTTAPTTRARSVGESESSMEQYEKSNTEKHLTIVREERDMLSAKLRERDIQIQSLLLQKESDARRLQMIETHRADERWHRALEASGLVRTAFQDVNVAVATVDLEEAVRANPELRSTLGGSVAEKTFARAVDDLEDVIGQLRCDNVMLARRVSGSPVPPAPPSSAAPDGVDGDDVWALCRERDRLEAAVREVYDELGRVHDEKQTSEEEFENLLQANHDLLQEITFLKDWLMREGAVSDEDGNEARDRSGAHHPETGSASMPILHPSSSLSGCGNQPSNDDLSSSFS